MPKARYKEIVENISGQISCGELAPGSRIESIREMCCHYGVSPTVALRVFRELAEAGIVERHDGEGYYVAVPRKRSRGDKIICLFRPLRDYNPKDNFGNRVIYGIMNEALSNHQHVVFPESTLRLRSRIPEEREVILMAEELADFRDAAGFLVDMRISDDMLEKYIIPAAGGLPIAVIGRRSKIPYVLSSEFPHEAAGKDAASIALKSHAEYVYHFTDHTLPDSFRMTQAFVENLKAGKHPPVKIQIRDGCDTAGREECFRNYEEIIQSIREHPGKVFIFTGTDATAEFFLKYNSSLSEKLIPGEDFSIVGFGGYSMYPSKEKVATFAVDIPMLGTAAVRLLLESRNVLSEKHRIAPYKLDFNSSL